MSGNKVARDIKLNKKRRMLNYAYCILYSYRAIDRRNSSSQEWNPEEGRMSPSRRTFCLFTTFDLILTFILWVIYTQVCMTFFIHMLLFDVHEINTPLYMYPTFTL